MRFWKWILITVVKVFAYSANSWRSLRGVCGPSWRIILGSQRAQNSLCGVAKMCVHRHTYTNGYSRHGSCLPDPEKQSTHGASVLFHKLVGEWTLMQPSRLQNRRNDNLSIHNTVTLKMSECHCIGLQNIKTIVIYFKERQHKYTLQAEHSTKISLFYLKWENNSSFGNILQ